MAKFRLGRNQFQVKCEVISASGARVSSEEVASLMRRMQGPGNVNWRVKTLNLVSPVSRIFLLLMQSLLYYFDAWPTEQ
jgi:hypothetical protein